MQIAHKGSKDNEAQLKLGRHGKENKSATKSLGGNVQILFMWMNLNQNTKYKNHDNMECLDYTWQSYFEHEFLANHCR